MHFTWNTINLFKHIRKDPESTHLPDIHKTSLCNKTHPKPVPPAPRPIRLIHNLTPEKIDTAVGSISNSNRENALSPRFKSHLRHVYGSVAVIVYFVIS